MRQERVRNPRFGKDSSLSTLPHVAPSFLFFTLAVSDLRSKLTLATWTTRRSCRFSRKLELSLNEFLWYLIFRSGYGIQIRFVEGLFNIDNNLAASMDWAFSEIGKFQFAARFHKTVVNPRWPMLVLRTPIGLSSPKKVRGEYVEGPFHSGQVPFLAARTSEDDLQALEDWLSSFNPRELFSEYGALLRVIPEANCRKLRWKPT